MIHNNSKYYSPKTSSAITAIIFLVACGFCTFSQAIEEHSTNLEGVRVTDVTRYEQERIHFWVKNYTVLDRDHSLYIETSYNVFDSLVNAAGRHSAVVPRLIVIQESPYNFSLPLALSDGGIVISSRIINKLVSHYGEIDFQDVVAFVLGHELAHIYARDFWHMQFFRLMKLSSTTKNNMDELNIAKSILDGAEEIIEKELLADEQGLIYMTLAGYKPQKIVSYNEIGSVFSLWNNISVKSEKKWKPLVSEKFREEAVKARLSSVVEKSYIYKLAINLFVSSDYLNAARLFEEYSLTLPSREVFHNLAMSYHFAAINEFTPDEINRGSLPFKFSFMIDPYERLFLNTRRSQNEKSLKRKKNYSKWINKAIKYYQVSLDRDPSYLPAGLNLSTAYMMVNEAYKSIGLLRDIEKIKTHAGVLNNLGIAFDLIGDHEKSRDYFLKVINSDEVTTPVKSALYNLGRSYFLKNEIKKSKKTWRKYLKHDSGSNYSSLVASLIKEKNNHTHLFTKNESIEGQTLNRSETAYLKQWNLTNRKRIVVGDLSFSVLEFDRGIDVVMASGTAKILQVNNGYKGSTSKNIKIGQNEQDIIHAYGHPSKIHQTPDGKILNYMKHRIAFYLRSNKIYSWTIYL